MSDEGKPLGVNWKVRAEAAEDHCAELWDRTQAAEARVRERDRAIRKALDELGVPDENYPAPVGNAVDILHAALNPPAEDDPAGLVPMDGMKHQRKLSVDEGDAPFRAFIGDEELEVRAVSPADEERHKDG